MIINWDAWSLEHAIYPIVAAQDAACVKLAKRLPQSSTVYELLTNALQCAAFVSCGTSYRADVQGFDAGEMRPPLTVVLINNSGGGIFSFLPIANDLDEDVFTQLWSTPQNVDLAGQPLLSCHTLTSLCLAIGKSLLVVDHMPCCPIL